MHSIARQKCNVYRGSSSSPAARPLSSSVDDSHSPGSTSQLASQPCRLVDLPVVAASHFLHVDGGRLVLLEAIRPDVVVPDVATVLVYCPVAAAPSRAAAEVDVRGITVT